MTADGEQSSGVTAGGAERGSAVTARRARRWAGPAAVALLSGAVGLYGLGEKSFWTDEGATGSTVVLGSWEYIWESATQHEPNLGLYYALLKVWSVLGTSEFVLRLFSLLCMVATAALLCLLGRRLFSPRVGLIAGILFGVNAFILRFAQEARPYALGVLTVTAASLLLVIALEKGSARWWVAYTTAAVVAVFANPWGATVIAAHIVAMRLHTKRPPWKPTLLTGLVMAVILGPFVLRLTTSDVNRINWIPETTWDALDSTIEQLAGGSRPVLGLYMAASLLALAALARRRRPDWPILLAGLWAVMPVVLLVAASTVKPVFVPRYTIVALPGLILLVAAGLDRLRLARLVALATAVVVVAAVPGLRAWYDSDFKADWRGGAALVTERKAPDDIVLIHRQGRGAFRYYESSLPVGLLTDPRYREAAVERERFWLALFPPPADDAVITSFQDALAQSHRLAGEWQVNQITLRLYVKQPPPAQAARRPAT